MVPPSGGCPHPRLLLPGGWLSLERERESEGRGKGERELKESCRVLSPSRTRTGAISFFLSLVHCAHAKRCSLSLCSKHTHVSCLCPARRNNRFFDLSTNNSLSPRVCIVYVSLTAAADAKNDAIR